jgi:hypothetical protein
MTGSKESRGVWNVGGDLKISNFSIAFSLDGTPVEQSPVDVELRTDMWPFWLEEAVDAAVLASDTAAEIPSVAARIDAGEDTDPAQEELRVLVGRELRASMRAITSSAFAIDAFYATVKARGGPHPDEATWRQKRTARKRRITETLRYHLIKNNADAKTLKAVVAQVFECRDWAVHMAADYRPPYYREDVNASMDWHFSVFRGRDAVMATVTSLRILDILVAALDVGRGELAASKQLARKRLNGILDRWASVDGFPSFVRAEAEDSG